MPTTAKDLQLLLQQLQQDPNNLDLLNSIAIGYFENYAAKTGREDYDYFEKAYQLKKTVKSTHNLAWFLYFEWSEIEWRWQENVAIEHALAIQQECLALQPQSYYPYFQYGYMLLDQRKYAAAIPYLEQANQLEEQRAITNNIGYCHFQLGHYQQAKLCFEAAAQEQDVKHRSLFNLALTAFQLGELAPIKAIADQLAASIKTNVHTIVSGYEVGLLYFLLNDYSSVEQCLWEQGITGIDLFDWKELSYSLYKANYGAWEQRIVSRLEEKLTWIKEIENGHEDWADISDEEQQEQIAAFKQEIFQREHALEQGITKPTPDLTKSILVDYCGCLLFDCQWHGNPKDDFLKP